jgi:hypothetical protein
MPDPEMLHAQVDTGYANVEEVPGLAQIQVDPFVPEPQMLAQQVHSIPQRVMLWDVKLSCGPYEWWGEDCNLPENVAFPGDPVPIEYACPGASQAQTSQT